MMTNDPNNGRFSVRTLYLHAGAAPRTYSKVQDQVKRSASDATHGGALLSLPPVAACCVCAAAPCVMAVGMPGQAACELHLCTPAMHMARITLS